jgi:cytochrome c-type biogenesis protein CcmH/NrfF
MTSVSQKSRLSRDRQSPDGRPFAGRTPSARAFARSVRTAGWFLGRTSAHAVRIARWFVGRTFTCDIKSPGQKGLQPLKFLASLISIALLLAAASQAHAVNADRAKNLSRKVMCMCGGCNDTAGTCNHTGGAFSGPCDTAKAMQKEVADRVARGDSDDLILQSFVQEYGPAVLPEPPKKGFTWLVWIAPVALPLIALFLIWEMVRRWRHRQELAPAGGPPVSSELLDRARREVDRETHE